MQIHPFNIHDVGMETLQMLRKRREEGGGEKVLLPLPHLCFHFPNVEVWCLFFQLIFSVTNELVPL